MKYYAKELPRESFNCADYFSDVQASYRHFWAGDNANFRELNAELVQPIREALEQIHFELSNYCANNPKVKKLKDIDISVLQETIVPLIKKASGHFIWSAELRTIAQCAFTYCNASKGDSYKEICSVLAIIYDEPFSYGIICGNGQNEWLHYICPEKVKQSSIKSIESLLFATGVEVKVSHNMLESAAELDKLDVNNTDEVDVYYFENCPDEDLKAKIAKLHHCNIEDLVLLRIADSHTVTTYVYREC